MTSVNTSGGFQSNKALISIVSVLLSITFAVRASNNMFVTSVPILSREIFLFSNVNVGVLVSISSIATFLSSTFINAKLQSNSRRKAMIISSGIYAAIFPLFAFSSPISIWIVLPVATFTLGITMPNIITSASLFKDRRLRERILSIYTLTLSLSLIAGPFIESEILNLISLQESFLVFSIFPAIAFIDSLFLKFPTETKRKVKGAFDFSIIKERGFVIALLNIIGYNVPFAFLTTYGGLYGIHDFNESYSLVNLTFASFFATSFISRLFFSWKVPQFLKGLMIWSVVMSSIGLAVIGFANSYLMLLIAFLILGIPHGLTYPLSVMTITRSFEEDRRNLANSYFFSILMLIGAAMPFISGEVIFLVGYREGFLLIIPVILIILLALTRVLLKEDHMVEPVIQIMD